MPHATKSSKGPKHETATAPAAGPRGITRMPPHYGIAFVDGAAAEGGAIQLMPPGRGSFLSSSDHAVIQRRTPLVSPNRTGLPDHLKAGIETLSGFDLSDVSVHFNSTKPAALQALAYTQGTDIHVAPGQERHLPHEAWHVVQQKQGQVRPRFQLKGEQINDDQRLEHEAEVMGNNALVCGASLQGTQTFSLEQDFSMGKGSHVPRSDSGMQLLVHGLIPNNPQSGCIQRMKDEDLKKDEIVVNTVSQEKYKITKVEEVQDWGNKAVIAKRYELTPESSGLNVMKKFAREMGDWRVTGSKTAEEIIKETETAKKSARENAEKMARENTELKAAPNKLAQAGAEGTFPWWCSYLYGALESHDKQLYFEKATDAQTNLLLDDNQRLGLLSDMLERGNRFKSETDFKAVNDLSEGQQGHTTEYHKQVLPSLKDTGLVYRSDSRDPSTIKTHGGSIPRSRMDAKATELGMDEAWNPFSNRTLRQKLILRLAYSDNDLNNVVSLAVDPREAVKFPLPGSTRADKTTVTGETDEANLYVIWIQNALDTTRLIKEDKKKLFPAQPETAEFGRGELGAVNVPYNTHLLHINTERHFHDESVDYVAGKVKRVTLLQDQKTYMELPSATRIALFKVYRMLTGSELRWLIHAPGITKTKEMWPEIERKNITSTPLEDQEKIPARVKVIEELVEQDKQTAMAAATGSLPAYQSKDQLERMKRTAEGLRDFVNTWHFEGLLKHSQGNLKALAQLHSRMVSTFLDMRSAFQEKRGDNTTFISEIEKLDNELSTFIRMPMDPTAKDALQDLLKESTDVMYALWTGVHGI